MTARLTADVVVDRGDFRVAATFDVSPGECVAILGPNGAGKSTILSALAGLTPLTAGHVAVDERPVDDAAGGRRPPEERGIALLDQRSRLFPHLTVEKNISFGPRAAGRPRHEVAAIVDGWLERIGLAERRRAKPHELSGGQQQRVAIARAFASAPRVILLDEPFASLDAESGPIVRQILSDELASAGTTAVLVTHDLADAWQWADECLVLDQGRVIEQGATADVALRPRRAFTAALSGFGVISGRWADGALRVGEDRLPGEPDGVRAGEAAIGIVAPREVDVAPAAGGTGALPAVVIAVSVHAGLVRLATDTGLSVELAVADAVALGAGSLPVAGLRCDLRPRVMRVVPDSAEVVDTLVR